MLSSCFLIRLLYLRRVWLNIHFVCSDAGDVTSPRREAVASPARAMSPMHAPTPPQPEATPTTPAPSADKTVAAPDLTASSSRPATWEEHVSAFAPRIVMQFCLVPYSYILSCSRLVAL